jgi:glycine cleavage system aminomethyltransferase T
MPEDGPPLAGSRIAQSDREVGWLGSVAFSDALGKGIALALMKCAAIESGNDLTIKGSEGSTPIPAKISALPFLKPAEGK